MKINRSPLVRLLITMPLLSAGFSTPLAAQDEDPSPDANPAPTGEEATEGDVEIPEAPLNEPGTETVPQEAQSEEPSSTEAPPEDIPEEIQAQVDESGPAVDDSYNSTTDMGDSIFSSIYVGPTVQIGFPQPLTYGLEAMIARTVSFGFSTGSYTVDQIDKAEIEIKGWDLHARWHPWLSSFFVGASYGRMEVDGKFEDKFKARINGFERDVDARVDATIETNYFTPRIGWFAVWESGLTVGFEVGAQIPMGPDTKVSATLPGATAQEEAQIKATEDYQELEDQADEAVKVLGKRTLPVVTLFRVGWLF